jgi:beta-phosphoglucomutase-like phosphatase (HAD superfamily)
VVAIADADNGEPDRVGFRHALAELNTLTAADQTIEPHQIVAVEDATGGAQGASAAGMRVAAIRGLGYDPASGYADVVVDGLDRTALELMLGIEGA